MGRAKKGADAGAAEGANDGGEPSDVRGSAAEVDLLEDDGMAVAMARTRALQRLETARLCHEAEKLEEQAQRLSLERSKLRKEQLSIEQEAAANSAAREELRERSGKAGGSGKKGTREDDSLGLLARARGLSSGMGVTGVEALAQRDIEAQRHELAQTVRDLIDAHGLQGAQWRLDALARSGGAVHSWAPLRDARRPPARGRDANGHRSRGANLAFLAGCAGAASAIAAGGVLLYIRMRDAGQIDKAREWLHRFKNRTNHFLGGLGGEAEEEEATSEKGSDAVSGDDINADHVMSASMSEKSGEGPVDAEPQQPYVPYSMRGRGDVAKESDDADAAFAPAGKRNVKGGVSTNAPVRKVQSAR